MNSEHRIEYHKARRAVLLENCKNASDDYKLYVEENEENIGSLQPWSFPKYLVQADEKSYTYHEAVKESNNLKRSEKNVIIRKRSRPSGQEDQVLLDVTWPKKNSELTRNTQESRSFEKTSSRSIEEYDELVEQIFSDAKVADEEKTFRYYTQRDRILELHKQRYAENLRAKAQEKMDTCSLIMKNIEDLAIHRSEYFQKYSKEVSPTEVVQLFLNEQIIPNISEETVNSKEQLKTEEISDVADDSDRNFENYCNFKSSWELTDEFSDKLGQIQLAENILGHIVLRLLLTKYPKPSLLTPPDIPKVDVAVCVDDIKDSVALEILGMLLKERQIQIIQMEDAVNFCVEAYKLEATVECPETEEEIMDDHKKDEHKPKKKDKGNKSKEKAPKEKASAKNHHKADAKLEEIIPQFQDKRIQTPRLFPCEELTLSPKAELGFSAFLGKDLNDKSLVNMFVEYLKSLKDVRGWVLINYPRNFEQVVALEEALTAKSVLPKGFDDETVCKTCIGCPYSSAIFDSNAIFRTSKLLPMINSDPRPVEDYKSYLTAYVRVIQSAADDGLFGLEKEENALAAFYRNQGCLYSLYYKTYDFSTIKHLAKLIIGDYSMPPKTSAEIFGDTILIVEADFNERLFASDKSVKKGKSGSGGKVEKNTKKKEDGKKIGQKIVSVEIIREDKETQMPEVDDLVEIPAPPTGPEPKPGETEWKYFDLHVPASSQVALATFWENIEEIYVGDFKGVFFDVGMLRKAYVPYMDYVRRSMRNHMVRPDDKQTHLLEFRNVLDQFDVDMRSEDEVKTELLCRIHQFREKMWEICDERMRLAEERRREICEQDWLVKQTCALTNAFIAQLQLELDRCVDTLQLLNDYYSLMVTKEHAQGYILDKTLLTYISFSRVCDGFSIYYDFMKHHLMLCEHSSDITSPFRQLLHSNFGICITAAESYQRMSLKLLTAVETYLVSDGKGEIEIKLHEITEINEVRPKLMEEWRCAMDGEVLRTKCRLNVLKSHANTDLQRVLDYITRTFSELKNDIIEEYRVEIRRMQYVYDAFSTAIVKEMKIMSYNELSLSLLDFPTHSELHVQDHDCKDSLSIEQLSHLVNTFLRIAPNGTIENRTFSYIVQDVIVLKKEQNKWQRITGKNLNQLPIKFFGNVDSVDWRDFIVYNLCVEFPTEEELMETRRQFRKYDPNSNEYVYSQQFYSVKFWFEKYLNASGSIRNSRLAKAKDLLHAMYESAAGTVNYTALLLAFCKGEDVVLGVAKALELSLGKYVCWQVDLGEAFKEDIRRRKASAEEERTKLEIENVKTANEIVDGLIDETVHESDGCILEEMASVKTDLNRGNLEEIESDQGNELGDIFSNVEIGFEVHPNPPKVYYLPFEALLIVLKAALGREATENNFERKLNSVYASCRNSEFKGLVLAHEFLNSAAFRDLLGDSCKFLIRKPSMIIDQLINGT